MGSLPLIVESFLIGGQLSPGFGAEVRLVAETHEPNTTKSYTRPSLDSPAWSRNPTCHLKGTRVMEISCRRYLIKNPKHTLNIPNFKRTFGPATKEGSPLVTHM